MRKGKRHNSFHSIARSSCYSYFLLPTIDLPPLSVSESTTNDSASADELCDQWFKLTLVAHAMPYCQRQPFYCSRKDRVSIVYVAGWGLYQ